MAFSVTHRSTIDRNIRHLYSGLPGDIRFRNYGNSLESALDIHDRVRERHRRNPPRFEGKYHEYIPEYNTRLPRAPAFRHVSSEEVKDITTRLSQPTLMSILRQRAPASGRSTSTSPAACSSHVTISDGERDESNGGDDTEKKNNGLGADHHRKISYKDWSDDEGEFYFVGESGERNETGEDKRNINEEVEPGSSCKDVNGAEETNYLSVNESKEGYSSSSHEEDCSNPKDRNNSTRYESDDELYDKQNKQGKLEQSEYSSGSNIGANNEKKQNRTKPQSKKKLTILEEIMQLRLSNRTKQHTYSASPTPKKRNVENRGRVHSRLTYSPYSEPPPRRRNEYGTREYNPAKMPRRTWRDSNQSYPNTNQRIKEPFSQRSQARAGLTSSKFETSQNNSAKQYTRSKSAPAYKVIPERGDLNGEILRENGKPIIRNSSPNTNNHDNDIPIRFKQDNYLYQRSRPSCVKCEREFPAQCEREFPAQCSNSEKNHYTKHGNCRKTNLSPSSDRSRNKSPMAISPLFVNKNDQLRRTNCCNPAVENDFLLRFDIKPAGKRTFIAGDTGSSRRYTSFLEMEQANARLMAPTTAQLIRDRMRYAPSNDKDLLDPVKVVHQETGRRKRNNRRGSLERDVFDDENIEEKDDNKKEKDEKRKKTSRERNDTDTTKTKVRSDCKMQSKGTGNTRQQRGDNKSTKERKGKNNDEKKKEIKERKEEGTEQGKKKGSQKESNISTEMPRRKIKFEDERSPTSKQNYEQNEKKDIERDHSDLDRNAVPAAGDILVSEMYDNTQDKALESRLTSSDRSRSSSTSRSRSSESNTSRNSSSSRSNSVTRTRSKKRSRRRSKKVAKSRSSSREINQSENMKISSQHNRHRSKSRSRSRTSSPTVSRSNANHSTTSPDRNESLSSPKEDGPRGEEQQHMDEPLSDNIEGVQVNDKGVRSTDDPIEENDEPEEDVRRGIVDENGIDDERGNKIERKNEEWGQRNDSPNDIFDINEKRRNSDALESRTEPKESDGYNVVNDRMIRGHENAMDNEWRDFNNQRCEYSNEDSTIISDAQDPNEYHLQENNGFDGVTQKYVNNNTQNEGNDLPPKNSTVEENNERYEEIAPDTIQESSDHRTQENNQRYEEIAPDTIQESSDHRTQENNQRYEEIAPDTTQESSDHRTQENNQRYEEIAPDTIQESNDHRTQENNQRYEEIAPDTIQESNDHRTQENNHRYEEIAPDTIQESNDHRTQENNVPEGNENEPKLVEESEQKEMNIENEPKLVEESEQKEMNIENEPKLVEESEQKEMNIENESAIPNHIHETDHSDVEEGDKDRERTMTYDQQKPDDLQTQEKSVRKMLNTLDDAIYHNVSNQREDEM